MAEIDISKLTPAQIREAELSAKRLLAINEARKPNGLLRFTQLMKPDPEDVEDPDRSMYQVAVHHRLLAELLTLAIKREKRRIAISMPPQHGKSELASRMAPAYVIGHYSWANLMMGTYNQDFANEFGDDVRAVVESPIYGQVFPNTRLRTGSKAKDHMVTTAGGKLSFLGRGGSGTGRPADFFFIDDPLKNSEEASSLTIRDVVWNWFTRVANTRCHGMSVQVIIQTRWSDDDLIGRLVDPSNPHYNAEIAKQWTYINIPAILDNEDIAKALGKKIGEALWPERFPLWLLEQSRLMDPIGFSALYQGRPTPLEGAFYKADQIYTYQRGELPKNLRMYGSGDLAVSPEIHADHTCVGNWGLDDKDELWLLPELYWEKKSSDASVEQIIDFGKNYKWMTFFAEKGPIDRSVGPFLRKRMRERGTHFHIETFPTTGDKGMRSTSIRGRMAFGKVHYPAFAPWWQRAKEQMLKFTGSGDDTEDDFCLLGGTMIEMADGRLRSIETIAEGEFVQTPIGPRRVVQCGMTKASAALSALVLGNGCFVIGTAAHMIYSDDQRRFVRMDHLCQDERVQMSRSWFTRDGGTGAIQNPHGATYANISNQALQDEAFCIATFGKTLWGKFQAGMRSITSTETRPITPSPTWNASRAESTSDSTCESQRGSPSPRALLSCTPGQKLLIGTNPRPGESGILEWLQTGSVEGVYPLKNQGEVYNLEVEEASCYYANGILVHNCDMIAMIGQGLGGQIRASAPDDGSSKVIYPKVGTFGWTVRRAKEEAQAKARATRGGW